MDDLLHKLRDAVESAAGSYVPPTDEQRAEWLALVQEADERLEEEGDPPW